MEKKLTKCPKCGCKKFIGHQVVRMNIVVDPNGNFLKELPGKGNQIYDSETPYGPFTCMKCDFVCDELPITEDVPEEDKVAEVVKRLEEKGIQHEDLDDAVTDACSAQASNINNGGLRAQAEFLLQDYGGDIELMMKTLG